MTIPNGPWDYEYESSSGVTLDLAGWSNCQAMSMSGGYLHGTVSYVGDSFNAEYYDGGFSVMQIRCRVFGVEGEGGLYFFNSPAEGIESGFSAVTHGGVHSPTSYDIIAPVDDETEFHTYTLYTTESGSCLYVDDVHAANIPLVPPDTATNTMWLIGGATSPDDVTFDIEWIAARTSPGIYDCFDPGPDPDPDPECFHRRFEYPHRWAQLGQYAGMTAETIARLEERDRALEDFLEQVCFDSP